MKRNLISWLKMSLCLGLFVLACLVLCDILLVYYSQFSHEEQYQTQFHDDLNPDYDVILNDFTPHYFNNRQKMHEYEKKVGPEYFTREKIPTPLVIWWTPFTMDKGQYKTCGRGEDSRKCFFTNLRGYRSNDQTNRALMFYGTDFYLHDLPLPRDAYEEWALLHEESPKNNYLFSYPKIMELFNHTATFKRQSDLTLITQYLSSIDDVEDPRLVVATKEKNRLQIEEGLAPIAYIQSDCICPSDRDVYVAELMKYVRVDSYGQCLHNKDLPENLSTPVSSMFSEDFYRIVAKYKFVISMENSVCDDYVTEKLWRAFYIGTVPVVYGSPLAKDIFPTNKSAIEVTDFAGPEEMAKFIQELNQNDEEYEKYLSYKTKGGVTNTYLRSLMETREWGINNDQDRGSYIDKLECLVCERLHENMELKSRNEPVKVHRANWSHYGCPLEKTFSSKGRLIDKNFEGGRSEWRENSFQFSYDLAFNMQRVFFEELLPQGIFNFSAEELQSRAMQSYYRNARKEL